MLCLKRVRSKVSDAPSTISIPHPQPSESAFKHTLHSQKTRFSMFFQKFKKIFEKPLFRIVFVFFSNMTTPVRPTELRKIFHRLTHIWSIRSQWNFLIAFFLMSESYIVSLEILFFQCKSVYRYGVVFGVVFDFEKTWKTHYWAVFQFQFKGVVLEFSSYSSIFKTKLKRRSAPNFSQSVRRRHLKMGTWGKRTRKGSFQFKPSENLCST